MKKQPMNMMTARSILSVIAVPVLACASVAAAQTNRIPSDADAVIELRRGELIPRIDRERALLGRARNVTNELDRLRIDAALAWRDAALRALDGEYPGDASQLIIALQAIESREDVDAWFIDSTTPRAVRRPVAEDDFLAALSTSDEAPEVLAALALLFAQPDTSTGDGSGDESDARSGRESDAADRTQAELLSAQIAASTIAESVESASWLGSRREELFSAHRTAALDASIGITPENRVILEELAGVIDRVGDLRLSGRRRSRARDAIESIDNIWTLNARDTDRADLAVRRLERVVDGVERHRQYAEFLTPADAPAQIQRTAGALTAAAEQSEIGIFDVLPIIVGAEDAVSDPALVAIATDFRESVDDLARMHARGDQLRTIRAFDPLIVDAVQATLDNWLLQLAAPARRTEATRALDRFDAILAELDESPMEAELAAAAERGDRSAQALAVALARSREVRVRQWAGVMRDVDRGVPANADVEMILDATAAAERLRLMSDDAIAAVNRLPGWYLPVLSVRQRADGLSRAAQTARERLMNGTVEEVEAAAATIVRDHAVALVQARLLAIDATALAPREPTDANEPLVIGALIDSIFAGNESGDANMGMDSEVLARTAIAAWAADLARQRGASAAAADLEQLAIRHARVALSSS